jgi:hypothetical protein
MTGRLSTLLRRGEKQTGHKTRGFSSKLLPVLAMSAALAPAAVPAENSHLSCKPAQIAFDIPRSWVIDNERTLFEQGFIVPPVPLYALVASPGPLPSHYAFNPSSTPWLFVTVETDDNLLPPSQLYELAPEYLQYLADNSPRATTSVKSLAEHHVVQQGGLSGSTAALTVSSTGAGTSIDEVAYEKVDRLWLVIAGCSVSCYDHNRNAITQIVSSVRVGTAA